MNKEKNIVGTINNELYVSKTGNKIKIKNEFKINILRFLKIYNFVLGRYYKSLVRLEMLP